MAPYATQPKLHSMFCALFLKIALSAAELMSFGHLRAAIDGAVKDSCYADKPETIEALKDNIGEAIGEIQLHTIENAFKAAIWMKLFFIINRKDYTKKKEIWENIQ